MSKLGKKSRWKIQRQLGLELPGLGRPGALEKRAYPPGQHGPDAKKRKPSGYALQLREKQKLLFHFGLREEQLRRFVRMAKRREESNWISRLITLLELRVDNIVFRLGLARSIAAARQLVSHGHILVNGRRLTIPSAILPVGARISITERAKELPGVQASIASPRIPLAPYLQLSFEHPLEFGIIAANPAPTDIPFEFNSTLVAEYYASRGVK